MIDRPRDTPEDAPDSAEHPTGTELNHNTFHGPAPISNGSGHQINYFNAVPPENRGPDSLAFLSAGVIQLKLAAASPHEAADSLARLNPDKAAEVIRLMPEKRRIAIIPSMDEAPASAILRRLPEEVAAPLHLAMRAARAISTDAADWHDVLGDASGDLERRGRSQRGANGFVSHYDRGTIYWSETGGTGMVAGAIKKRYWKLGGNSGRLGYPIGRETHAATSRFGTSGTFQRFESTWDYGPEALARTVTVCGATLYASVHGVFATWAGIGEYFEASGGTWGPLGFPLSEEMPVPGSSGDTTERYRQDFEGGTVYWSEQTGVAQVHPPIQEFLEQHALVGWLPLGDQEAVAQSQQGTAGVVQPFQYGPGDRNLLVYSSVERGTWSISGVILIYFEAHGATAGPFGFPVEKIYFSAMEKSEDIWKVQQFESGAIVSYGSGETLGVTGTIFALWSANREVLGVPTAEQRTLGDGPDLLQCFKTGVVTVIDGIARYWLSPGVQWEPEG